MKQLLTINNFYIGTPHILYNIVRHIVFIVRICLKCWCIEFSCVVPVEKKYVHNLCKRTLIPSHYSFNLRKSFVVVTHFESCTPRQCFPLWNTRQIPFLGIEAVLKCTVVHKRTQSMRSYKQNTLLISMELISIVGIKSIPFG